MAVGFKHTIRVREITLLIQPNQAEEIHHCESNSSQLGEHKHNLDKVKRTTQTIISHGSLSTHSRHPVSLVAVHTVPDFVTTMGSEI